MAPGRATRAPSKRSQRRETIGCAVSDVVAAWALPNRPSERRLRWLEMPGHWLPPSVSGLQQRTRLAAPEPVWRRSTVHRTCRPKIMSEKECRLAVLVECEMRGDGPPTP